MKIVFATANKGKLKEAAEILGPEFELLCPADLGIFEDIEETGQTLEENSMLKARYIYEKTGLDCFADDTGLEVDALGGAPGIHSARFASDVAMRDGDAARAAAVDHNFAANVETLLAELAKLPDAPRTARFRSVVTLILGGEVHTFEGKMEGQIAKERAGTNGFGYDPVFIADECPGMCIAEGPIEIKNAISHRGKSLREMASWLKSQK